MPRTVRFLVLAAFIMSGGLLGVLPRHAWSSVGEARGMASWTQATSPTIDSLSDVAMVSAIDGWAVGQNGTILRWDGTAWNPVASPTTMILWDVDVVSPSDIWAVGGSNNDGVILHWDGSSWSLNKQTSYLAAVDLATPAYGWAVGSTAAMYLWNGSQWDDVVRNYFTYGFNDIAMLSATDGWAAGYFGSIIRWDGTRWAYVPSGTSQHLRSLSFVSASDGWTVGDGGSIRRWNGASWSSVPSPVTQTLLSVSAVSATNAMAVGSAGTILQWDGTMWRSIASPTSNSLFSVEMLSATEGWAVGAGGTILQYSTPSPTLATNYSDGAPNSFFTLMGDNFPPDAGVTISVNRTTLGTATVGSDGVFTFRLATSSADPGSYYVTAIVASPQSSATTHIVLDPAAPVRPQEGSGVILDVPSGIAWEAPVYLPTTSR